MLPASRLCIRSRRTLQLLPPIRQHRSPFSSSRKCPESQSNTSNYIKNLFNVENKVIIVTGGSGGLGLAMSEALVRAGATIHCIDLAPEPNSSFNALKSSTPQGHLHYHSSDITSTPTFQSLISDIAARNSRLDGLITSAGVFPVKPALDITQSEIIHAWSVLYLATFTAAQAAAREMLRYKTPGSMALIGSMSGLVANKGFPSTAYNTCKAGVIQLARNLSQEWGGHGIRVNALCPGYIATPAAQKVYNEKPEVKKELEGQNMMGRLAEPEEFGAAGIFLMSNASSYMTGAGLVMDGGHTAW